MIYDHNTYKLKLLYNKHLTNRRILLSLILLSLAVNSIFYYYKDIMNQNRPVFRRKACTNPHKTLVFRYIYSFFLFEFVLYLYFTVSKIPSPLPFVIRFNILQSCILLKLLCFILLYSYLDAFL